jgi:hypothetical protein
MSLGGSYKKPLFMLVLLFFVYKLFDYYSNIYEGLTPMQRCRNRNNCASCIDFSHPQVPNGCRWNQTTGKCGLTGTTQCPSQYSSTVMP